MSWIKRNLYFLLGSAVAILLLGLACFYFWNSYSLNNENLNKLNQAYQTLDQLIRANPSPGNEQVDNIDIAKKQRAQVEAVIAREQRYFTPIAAVPAVTNGMPTKDEFASALRRTLNELANTATDSSVTIPPNYSFSFDAERSLTIFAEGSLAPLSVQLGEVRAICRILFQAKVNSLDAIRRERVSQDDLRGAAADYIAIGGVTNSEAVLTPYEVNFQCFSGELAAVLSGFATNTQGILVRALNVQPAGQDAGAGAGAMVPGQPGGAPYNPYAPYGYGGTPAPTVTQPTTRGGLPVLLDEKQLRVNLVLVIVKPLPEK